MGFYMGLRRGFALNGIHTPFFSFLYLHERLVFEEGEDQDGLIDCRLMARVELQLHARFLFLFVLFCSGFP